MDNVTKLCDELLEDIFKRLKRTSPTSLQSVSLVCTRWLHLYRASRTELSVTLNSENSTINTLSTTLSHYPFVSSLSIATVTGSTATEFNDQVLVLVSSLCSRLKELRFLAGSVSCSSLLHLCSSHSYASHLTSLTVSISRPFFLNWVVRFSCLKLLNLYVSDSGGVVGGGISVSREDGFGSNGEIDAELGLESLSLSGIRSDDHGLGSLWRSCKKLKKLQLKSCGGVGDGGSFSSFTNCLPGIEEVELRTSRCIVHGVLLKLADNCDSLSSLLVYDGGSVEGLLEFINTCRSNLRKLEFRLPLDLVNDHLSSVGAKFTALSSLTLQSCCLVSGEGLKAIAVATSSGLDEMGLINCHVVERESGLLATLGQVLRKLRKLDLSHNECLNDKELTSMLVSCNRLIELKLRGCKGLTGSTTLSMFNSCKELQCVDIMHCPKISASDVELVLLNSSQLRRLHVEETKLSNVAMTCISHRSIQVLA